MFIKMCLVLSRNRPYLGVQWYLFFSFSFLKENRKVLNKSVIFFFFLLIHIFFQNQTKPKQNMSMIGQHCVSLIEKK